MTSIAGKRAYFQHINASSGNVAQEFVLFFKVPSKHLGRLIYGMFYLDGHTTSRLRLLNNLCSRDEKERNNEHLKTKAYILSLVIDFQ